MRIGIDLDGVLCDFDRPFAKALTDHTKILFPVNDPEFPTTWAWPRAFGVTLEQEGDVIEKTILDGEWWLTLPAVAGARETLLTLTELQREGHAVYFITKRPDVAQFSSAAWLTGTGFHLPSVITTDTHKGEICKALGLDIMIDDHFDNVEDILVMSPATRVYLLDRSWNRHAGRREEIVASGGLIVGRVSEMFELEGLNREVVSLASF